jgi:hypothetical protein
LFSMVWGEIDCNRLITNGLDLSVSAIRTYGCAFCHIPGLARGFGISKDLRVQRTGRARTVGRRRNDDFRRGEFRP